MLALFWVLAKAALFRANVPPGVPPDELAHVSYAADVLRSGRFVPLYEEMRILDEAGCSGDLPNYLPHPSPYYAAIGVVGRAFGVPANPSLVDLTRRLRLASAPLFAAAAALFLFLGWRRAWSLSSHVVYAAAVSTVPAFAFVGAAVNNDVLAFLAGGIALLGISRRLEGRSDLLTATLLGAGVAAALLSKATAGLLVSVAVFAVLVETWRVAPRATRGRFLFGALPWLVLPALHYLPVLIRWGTPIPSLNVTNPEAFARSAFVVAREGARLSLPAWGAVLSKTFAATWLSIAGHVWLPVGPAWTLGGPALLLALAAIGLFTAGRGDADGDRSGALARIGAFAFAMTLVANLAWAYSGYLETGRIGGLHVRYYLPLLPCLGMAAVAGLRRLPASAWLTAVLSALLFLADAGVTVRYLRLFPAG